MRLHSHPAEADEDGGPDEAVQRPEGDQDLQRRLRHSTLMDGLQQLDKLGVLVLSVLTIRALLFGVCNKAPDFWSAIGITRVPK